jgi:hypothetical protein
MQWLHVHAQTGITFADEIATGVLIALTCYIELTGRPCTEKRLRDPL